MEHLDPIIVVREGDAIRSALFLGPFDAFWPECPVDVEALSGTVRASLAHHPPLGAMFGKPAFQRRDIAFFSNESGGYSYSRQIMKSQPLLPGMGELLEGINKRLKIESGGFNGWLVNGYAPDDYLSAHSDDERTIAPAGVFSLSIGATRTFRVRNKRPMAIEGVPAAWANPRFSGAGWLKTDLETTGIVADVELANKSVCLMWGQFQKDFTHEIPALAKRKRDPTQPDYRVSWTCRSHLE